QSAARAHTCLPETDLALGSAFGYARPVRNFVGCKLRPADAVCRVSNIVWKTRSSRAQTRRWYSLSREPAHFVTSGMTDSISQTLSVAGIESLWPMLMGTRHMAVAGHYGAAHAAFAILEAGGNAVDAGVAAGIALGVLKSDLVNVA